MFTSYSLLCAIKTSKNQKTQNFKRTPIANKKIGECGKDLDQGSQTCGPRECPMRPANIRKNQDLKGKIELFSLFYQIN